MSQRLNYCARGEPGDEAACVTVVRVVLSTQGKVPVKWLAPESIIDHVYTVQSDV